MLLEIPKQQSSQSNLQVLADSQTRRHWFYLSDKPGVTFWLTRGFKHYFKSAPTLLWACWMCERLRFLTKARMWACGACVKFILTRLHWNTCDGVQRTETTIHDDWMIPTSIWARLSPPFYLFSVRFDSFEGCFTTSPHICTNILWPNKLFLQNDSSNICF